MTWHHTWIDQSNASAYYLHLHTCSYIHSHAPFVNAFLNAHSGHSFSTNSGWILFYFVFFFVCVCPNCKPHCFSVASYMLLHVQDYRERRYTGPGIQSMPVYHAMEIQNTNGRCWMTSAFICFFGRRFLVEANCTKGWFVFIRPKRICVSVSDGESLTNSCHSFTTAKWIWKTGLWIMEL